MFSNIMFGYEIVEVKEEEIWGLNIKDHNGDWNLLNQTFSTKQEAMMELKNRIDRDYRNAVGKVDFDMYPTMKPKEGTHLYLDGRKKNVINNDVNDPLWYLYQMKSIPGVDATSKSVYHGKGWDTEKQAWNAMKGNVLLNIKNIKIDILYFKNALSALKFDKVENYERLIQSKQDDLEGLQERLDYINNIMNEL